MICKFSLNKCDHTILPHNPAGPGFDCTIPGTNLRGKCRGGERHIQLGVSHGEGVPAIDIQKMEQ